jgi:hypothetical protein
MHAKTENTKEAANTFRYCIAVLSASVVPHQFAAKINSPIPMAPKNFDKLLAFIPILESGALKDAHSSYISSGDYDPQVSDLQSVLKESGLCPDEVDWLAWVDEARPFLQTPETILSADAASVERLVALATYSERFNRSFFPHLCSSGFMLMLLRRLRDSFFN